MMLKNLALILSLVLLASCAHQPAARALKAKQATLPPVLFNGKPFFPIGAYDTYKVGEGGRLYSIDPDFIAAGGNFADLGQLGVESAPNYRTHSQPAIFEALEKMQSNPDYEKVAFIVGLGFAILMDASEAGNKIGHGQMYKPLSAAKLEQHKQILAEAVQKLRKYPNVIGYTMDEPENLIWAYYKEHHWDEWERSKDAGLSKKMVEWLNWTKPIIRLHHPEAKLFPILGWWTTYEHSAEMYDVLIANQYPGRKAADPEFSGPLYQVSYDAAMAVAAARKNGADRTVVYMPPMFDIINSDYANRSYKEQLYVNFAPVTRGCMGIHGWRLQRCSQQHRQEVIYPAMKELSKYSEYFLGEWLDEHIASDHDYASVDYLKEFEERVRLVESEEDGKMQEARVEVPDLSYCLRRHSDGSYLLLAVNNRREAIRVKFNTSLPGRLSEVKENLSGRKLHWEQRQLEDRFEPFAVHAYIFNSGK